MAMNTTPAVDQKWFGHPRGLSTLFFTEMWERFSYYGMRGILLLFLVATVQNGGFGLTDRTGAAIYGLYVGFVYLMALPGGWVADRILGQRRAVFVGGCIIAAGHFSMAVPTVWTFYGGLVLIVIGTGLLKPNVSAMVADLYPEGGTRRDAGFSVFYSGINVGALAGPLVCGFLGEKVNWHLGFSAAGVGMVLGLIQYRFGGKYLGSAGMRRAGATTAGDRIALRRLMIGCALVVAFFAGAMALQALGLVSLTLYGFAQGTGYFMLGLAILYFAAILLFGKLNAAEKKRIVVIFVFFMAAVLFWAGFEQAGSSLNLFAERLTNRVILGWTMPASFLQSVNSIFIIVLAPFFGALWIKLGRKQPAAPAKMGIGLVLLAVGFLVLAWGAGFRGQRGAREHDVVDRDVLSPHHGRALPISRRPFQRDEARAQESRGPADGDLVHGNGARQPHRRARGGRLRRNEHSPALRGGRQGHGRRRCRPSDLRPPPAAPDGQRGVARPG